MKYIFIDTNQYKHLYSPSEGFSENIFNLLLKLINSKRCILLLPQQTKDEIERNVSRKWVEDEVKKLNDQKEHLEEMKIRLKDLYSEFKGTNKLSQEIDREVNITDKKIEAIKKKYLNPLSKPNVKLRRLTKKAIIINEGSQIIKNAELRHRRGNPPYDAVKLGDALIWESLLDYLVRKKSANTELIFVANDKKAWGDDIFDPWLTKELKEKVDVSIHYSPALADIPELTVQEQKEIRHEEILQLKRDAIDSFRISNSFDEAGTNAWVLLKFKKILAEKDYEDIIKACVTNSQIHYSFRANTPVIELFRGKEDYAVSQLENIEDSVWELFKEYFKTDLKRQKDDAGDINAQKDVEEFVVL